MFKNLKSLFIVENEGESKSSPSKSQSTAKPTKQSSPKSSPPPSPMTSSTPISGGTASPGKVTDKFNKILFGAMEKNNIDGFDYLEYRQSLQSLKKMDMDEPTRYKSAYAMAQTMGASPDYLIKTAQHYIDVLQKEEDKFGKALQNQRTRQIGEKEQQLKDVNTMIRQKAEQIQKLSKQIEEHQAQIAQLENDVSQASVKVESTKNDFVASYQTIVGQIAKDVENMKQYLK